MNRNDEIQSAYRTMGGEHDFYDGMITCSTLPGRLVCRVVWGMGQAENARYIEKALSGIPTGFVGELLEIPVGTGVLTMPVYPLSPMPTSPASIIRRICWCGQRDGRRIWACTTFIFNRETWASCLLRAKALTLSYPSTASTPFQTRRLRTGRCSGC